MYKSTNFLANHNWIISSLNTNMLLLDVQKY